MDDCLKMDAYMILDACPRMNACLIIFTCSINDTFLIMGESRAWMWALGPGPGIPWPWPRPELSKKNESDYLNKYSVII